VLAYNRGLVSTARISPTAYYTGHVWCRNGLSDPALDTAEGAILFSLARPIMRVGRAMTGGVAVEEMLLQRHRIIDEILSRAIERGRVGQVLEIAGGMSGRGLRFSKRYGAHGERPDQGGLVYVEGDLPGMAERKRMSLAAAGLTSQHHRVVPLDILADSGPEALDAATRGLFDSSKGIAVVTEGLLPYFDTPTTEGVWRRIARFVAPFSSNLYLSDLHLGGNLDVAAVKVFRQMLNVFARGRTHVHFRTASEVAPALAKQGFAHTRVHRPRDWARQLALPGTEGLEMVQVLEASTQGEALE
jgi:O-methyltransferase involved in polyketide biosynthesis